MYRAMLLTQSRQRKILLNQRLDRLRAHPLALLTDKKRVLMPYLWRNAMGEIGLDGLDASLVKLDNSFFVAFSQ